ncbi:proteasomal ubiquitin receptor ADRM1 isoform X2 [Clupea harengus]|uniref:Proteasomal ubiquitin receptor ADRM1 isoform X2 n=1 Tax=Clupea harengus TaxID=7950 RepID=A0A6P3VUH5_CLUHA|nr:proteasomal ubiquitin receptor ADRM1 isoform X2 [Clupea harengus]
MSSGALFPSLSSGSRSSSSKYLVEFRAGKMSLKASTVTPDKRKGMVYVQQTDDSLIHFCWKDRTSGNVEDDLIIFPDDCEFKRVSQCTTGRVFVLKFKAGSKRLFFWMQEPKTDKDEEHCRKVNEFLNNPPMPGALGSGGSGSHELSALGEGGLQSLLGNMSHNQLMQLIGPTGLGGLGGLGALAGPGLASLLGSGGTGSSSTSSSRSQSAAATPSSGSAGARTSSAQAATTPVTPAASAPAAAAASPTVTPTTPAAQTPATPAGVASPTQPIQLSDLQSILATMNVPNSAASGQGVDLATVLTPEIMAPILSNSEVQERLLPYLPSGESLPQSASEIQNTLTSPQFQQAMSMFSSALASGQLGPLMNQFGLPSGAVDAANKGDVEAFAKAMEGADSKTEGSGDKKEDDEDMSLD